MTEALRDTARKLFAAACQAADPALALGKAITDHPLPKPEAGGRYLVLAIGKAAVPMAEEMLASLGDARRDAIIVTNYENARDVPGARLFAAGHPVPDENGAAAANAVEAMLREATANDHVIALISGGGSALLPAPAPGLTLDDKAEVNRILLRNGFEINEMNMVRQQLSRLKGGGLLRAAAPAPVTAYLLSDVIGDDLRAIASGPTVAPIGTVATARALLQSRGVWAELPKVVQAHLLRQEPDLPPLPSATNILIGSNRKSLDAIADAHPGARIVSDNLTGDVGEAANVVIAAALKAPPDVPACLIFGGETTVTLRGGGLGGRNQELALRIALSMPDLCRDWVFLSGGTDGRDGPTEAAGGIVDAGTADRIRGAGEDPDALLANNDSNAALGLADDLLMTGATGTNVADVQILLIGA